MFKLIQILLFISLLQSTIYAETTKDDVDNYIDVSRGGALITHIYKFDYKKFFIIKYGFDIKKAKYSTVKEYKKFILNPKYGDIFYETLSKIEDSIFYEIMEFYKSKLGKKYAQAFKEIYADNTAEMLLKIIEEEKKSLLQIRRPLVSKINKALSYNNLYINLRTISTMGHNIKALQKDKLFATKQINELIENKHAYLEEFISIFSEIVYKDFTDEELSHILVYINKYGRTEMEFVYKALGLYKQKLYKDVHKLMEKEKSVVYPVQPSQ